MELQEFLGYNPTIIHENWQQKRSIRKKICTKKEISFGFRPNEIIVVGTQGFEPGTDGLRVRCSTN